jgi:(2Fe-2S) ferredoxin
MPDRTQTLTQEISICQYDNCLRHRSAAVLAAFQSIELPVGLTVTAGGCQGQCHIGPNVQILSDDPDRPTLQSTWYCQVKPEDVPEIIQVHGQLQDRSSRKSLQRVTRLLNPRLHPQ